MAVSFYGDYRTVPAYNNARVRNTSIENNEEKDDGNIGFSRAVGNIAEGGGKTLANLVTGCFTDEDGSISIRKTLMTAGAAAVCVACPAIGLAACAVGLGTGAYHTVKGLYNVFTAQTDKEAEEACQSIGEGIVTAGLSATGGRAAFGAVKNSAKAENGISAITKMANKKNSSSNKEVGQAYATDMWASTKNGTKTLLKDVSEGLSVLDRSIPEVASNAAKSLSNGVYKVGNKIDDIKYSYRNTKRRNVKQNIKAARKSIGKTLNIDNMNSKVKSVIDAGKKVKNGAINIYEGITNPNSKFSDITSHYGYNNGAGALKVFAGEQV